MQRSKNTMRLSNSKNGRSACVPSADEPPTTVLLVEDDRSVRVSLARYLQAFGYRVVQAMDVEDAIAATARDEYAAVLLDVGLPDRSGLRRSGLDVLATIRSDASSSQPAVLLFTGYPLTSDEQIFIRSHDASLAYKPQNYRRLTKWLGQLQIQESTVVSKSLAFSLSD